MNEQENLKKNVQELCHILNSNNFKNNGSEWIIGSNPKYIFDGGICYDVKAFSYLKNNGHLDRKICWKCGKQPISTSFSFTHVSSQSVNYNICKNCYNSGSNIRSEIEGKGSSNCYIATVCYNDINAKQVRILRDYRDEYLAHNFLGMKFIRFYYKYSPKIANYMFKKKFLNKLVKNIILNPIVYFIKKK